ncbi:MAG: hypothetical protein A4E58_00285 [Syntrophorhabdus sp. PtaB.Bin006]|nr:MAG: hypothetical protein A4E58_00285 [Syntrophorhabdus sp. PtaB.Bin006]
MSTADGQKEQLKSDEFRRAYLEEKTKLDIEYRLEELKKISGHTRVPTKVEDLERFVMGE